MKKILLIILIISGTLLTACGNTFASKAGSEVEADVSPASLLQFDSLEDFTDAVKRGDDNKDIALLSELKNIAVPRGIPKDYELYKITAGAADIAFWYLPKALLDKADESAILDAEAKQEYYMFIDGRESYDFEKTLPQFGGNISMLIDRKYFVTHSLTQLILWEDDDGSVLMLYLPSGQTIMTDSNSRPLTETELLQEYCATEKLIFD